VIKKNLDKLYSEEISPATSPEYAEYVHLNLKKIKEFRKNFQIPVIGVAGADGKTTTKGMLSAILGQRGKILQTPLDCDSASIVSSTLLRLNNDYSYCLIEMGIFNQEQFKLAVEMSQPDIGIVTNIGEAHLAKLGDKYLIANANVELIRQLKADGYAVLNIDDELVSEMDTFAGTQRILKFGFNHAAHFHAAEIKYLGPDGMMFLVNNYYKFHLPIYSSTSVSNALAAIAAARILNFEFDEIQNGLKNHFKMIPGRGNFIELGDVFILDHTYNATINSVTKACESLVQFKNFSKNLILVIGSMDELGEKTINIHKNIGYYISALPIDMVITIGQDANYIAEGIRQINHNKKLLYHCQTAEQLPQTILNLLSPNTTILMTGGKSLNLKDYLANIIAKIKPSSAKTIIKTELSVNS
jgi:UDP-N-acetylmuramoyl-tripeptide--D-alanyl-D-alanine ligase